MPTGLANEAAIACRGPLDGFAVGNLGLADGRFNLELTPEAVHQNL